jgi:hypothetical protein
MPVSIIPRIAKRDSHARHPMMVMEATSRQTTATVLQTTEESLITNKLRHRIPNFAQAAFRIPYYIAASPSQEQSTAVAHAGDQASHRMNDAALIQSAAAVAMPLVTGCITATPPRRTHW